MGVEINFSFTDDTGMSLAGILDTAVIPEGRALARKVIILLERSLDEALAAPLTNSENPGILLPEHNECS
jgi:hypothetical protein